MEACMRWLIEVLVVTVVAVEVVLVPVLFTNVFVSRLQPSREEVVRTIDFPEIANALDGYRARHGQLPSEDAFSAVDPWGRKYIYERHGAVAHLKSLGRDGAVGGSGRNADLECWMLEPKQEPSLHPSCWP
jgi:hypothetical protein